MYHTIILSIIYYNSPAVKQISSHISDDHDNYHGADHDVVDDIAEEDDNDDDLGEADDDVVDNDDLGEVDDDVIDDDDLGDARGARCSDPSLWPDASP